MPACGWSGTKAQVAGSPREGEGVCTELAGTWAAHAPTHSVFIWVLIVCCGGQQGPSAPGIYQHSQCQLLNTSHTNDWVPTVYRPSARDGLVASGSTSGPSNPVSTLFPQHWLQEGSEPHLDPWTLPKLWTEVHNVAQEAVTKTIPKKKKCKKAKWLSEEVLQIAEKRRDTKGKR